MAVTSSTRTRNMIDSLLAYYFKLECGPHCPGAWQVVAISASWRRWSRNGILRKNVRFDESVVRLSVGIEAPEDIIADLEQALALG